MQGSPVLSWNIKKKEESRIESSHSKQNYDNQINKREVNLFLR